MKREYQRVREGIIYKESVLHPEYIDSHIELLKTYHTMAKLPPDDFDKNIFALKKNCMIKLLHCNEVLYPPRTIFDTVIKTLNLNRQEVIKKKPINSGREARYIYYMLCLKYSKAPTQDIGSIFNITRSTTTKVIQGSTKGRLETDKVLYEKYKMCECNLLLTNNSI